MRISVDLEASQVEALAGLATREGRSRAALIREAVDEYLRRKGDDEAFGLWNGAIDGLAAQERARSEW
jgi:metal-responsive CopG/Arc/MetJ family transcriptional regulator